MDINIYELENKLDALKIKGKYKGCKTTPFYIYYFIEFDPSVTINKINARKNDLEFIFGCKIEIETRAPYIAIKGDNATRDSVKMDQFMYDIVNNTNGAKDLILPLAIGKDANGHNVYFDLIKAPHLLIAGATGSGKSVFINSLILSLIYKNNTELVLFDIKRVELSIYNGLPHLKTDVITDVDNASKTLEKLCDIMDQRYITLQNASCRNIQEYRKTHKMNYITVIIDELADIMIQNKKAVEKYIIRLAQLGRACGIHLVVATQRPSTDIITGLIKSNIPSRICFSVASAIDSRVIIDKSGGERLRGNGDGLFLPIGASDPERIQAPYMSTENIIEFINYLKNGLKKA